MPIVTPPTGSFTPGAQATLDYSAAVINASWDLALDAKADLNTAIAAATGDFLDLVTVPHITAGTATGATVTEPTITIADAGTTGVYDDFETQYLALVAMLVTKFAAFQTDFFPDEHTLYTQAEDWLQSAITNGGLAATTQSQIWGDDQARILADANRAADAVVAKFAGQRFPLPSGAAASAVLQIQQKSQDELAESSRKVAIMSVEQMKFNIEKAINIRTVALSSAADYIKALASGPDMASRLVNVGYDAQSKMISAASQFYNSRIAAAELTNKTSQFNVANALQASEKNQAADMQLVEDKLKALLAEVQTLSQMATSLFNNLHANAGTQYSVSA